MDEPRQHLSTELRPIGPGLVPRNFGEAVQFAEIMAKGRMMPEHLRGNVGDALMVVEQAMRWNMSPFAVAQATFNIKGKLLFAGTLVAAAVENSGAIIGYLNYSFEGDGQARSITVSATRRGESGPRSIVVRLADARTTNENWVKQPDQQLVYHGVRVWARRWTPSVLLGVYSREEMEMPDHTIDGVVINDPVPDPVGEDTPDPAAEKKRQQEVWFDNLERELQEAALQGPAAVQAIAERSAVIKAQARTTGANKQALDDMLAWSMQEAEKLERERQAERQEEAAEPEA